MPMWNELPLQQLVLRLAAMVIIAGVHGIAVAATAVALGDPGPRYDGRLRLNPFIHLDLLGTASGVLFAMGWIKPIAVDPALLRPGRIGLVLIVIAGAAATLACALVLRLTRPLLLPLLGDFAAQTTFALIETIAQLSVWFALVNVLPLPNLTGGHLLTAIVPQWRDGLRRSQPYADVVLFILVALGFVTGALEDTNRVLSKIVLGG